MKINHICNFCKKCNICQKLLIIFSHKYYKCEYCGKDSLKHHICNFCETTFLANATSALGQMPRPLLKRMSNCLNTSQPQGWSVARSIVGHFLGCSGKRVKRCLQNLVNNSWQPASVVKIASATATRRSPSASAGGLPPPQDAKK